VGGVLSGAATTLAVIGGIDDGTLDGWPAALIGYPAAITVPLAFLTMIVVSRLTAATAPPDVARIFARMHVPERLGMGVERLPRTDTH
jgi:hypothetical protein